MKRAKAPNRLLNGPAAILLARYIGFDGVGLMCFGTNCRSGLQRQYALEVGDQKFVELIAAWLFRCPQDRGWVVRGDDVRAALVVKRGRASFRNADFAVDDCAQCGCAQCGNHDRAVGGDLRFEPVVAGCDFALRRRLVDAPGAARLPAEMLDRIGDIDVVVWDAGIIQRPPQEKAGRTDERLALAVFLVAGLLAHQHEMRPSRAFAGHALSSPLP